MCAWVLVAQAAGELLGIHLPHGTAPSELRTWSVLRVAALAGLRAEQNAGRSVVGCCKFCWGNLLTVFVL